MRPLGQEGPAPVGWPTIVGWAVVVGLTLSVFGGTLNLSGRSVRANRKRR